MTPHLGQALRRMGVVVHFPPQNPFFFSKMPVSSGHTLQNEEVASMFL
jgi:hypothetical protein